MNEKLTIRKSTHSFKRFVHENCLGPIAKVLHDNFTIRKGLMNTIHSYTNDQHCSTLAQGLEAARAAALSIIPTTQRQSYRAVLPELKGKLDGMSLRVPTRTLDSRLVAEVEKNTTKEEVNAAMKKRPTDRCADT